MAHVAQKHRAGDPVLLKVDSIRRSVVFWTLGWGYLWLALLIAALLFGGVLLDHALVLQKWGRLTFFWAFVALLVAVTLSASLFPLVRRMRSVGREEAAGGPDVGID